MAGRWETSKPHPKKLTRQDKDYGTPVAGSKTEARGKLAHERVSREILELCSVIEENGTKIHRRKICKDAGVSEETGVSGENGEEVAVTTIQFGRLFDIYTYISNKLVGVLLRARKYGLVDFEGETLFQRRDDSVVITLLYSPSKVREMLREKTFTWGKCL